MKGMVGGDRLGSNCEGLCGPHEEWATGNREGSF